MVTKQLNEDVFDPYPDEIGSKLYEEIILRLAQIGAGESIGDYAAAHDTNIEYSVISDTKCELLVIPASEFKEILGEYCYTHFLPYCRNYPVDMELRRLYYDNLEWKKVKNKTIQQTIQDNVELPKLREK